MDLALPQPESLTYDQTEYKSVTVYRPRRNYSRTKVSWIDRIYTWMRGLGRAKTELEMRVQGIQRLKKDEAERIVGKEFGPGEPYPGRWKLRPALVKACFLAKSLNGEALSPPHVDCAIKWEYGETGFDLVIRGYSYWDKNEVTNMLTITSSALPEGYVASVDSDENQCIIQLRVRKHAPSVNLDSGV